MTIQFTVPGEPKGKGRPRFTKNGHTYTPKETENYENLVKLEYHNQCSGNFANDAPLEMDIKAYFTIPKSASKKKREQMLAGIIRPTKKPDMDNIVKIIADALNGIAYHDDSQVIKATIEKYYGEPPHTEVRINNAVDKDGEL